MLGKSSSLLARPVTRHLRALPNGFVSHRLMHHSPFQAVKVVLAKNNASSVDNQCTPDITTLKEAYTYSRKLSTTSMIKAQNILTPFSPKNSSPQYKTLKAAMPQLVPFFFVNQVVFGFSLLVMLIYVVSKYFLPRFVRTFAARLFISKL